MEKRIIFPAKQDVALETFDLPPLDADQIQLRTVYTLISTGTETIVFNHLFAPGSHWDSSWTRYPFRAGYLNVAMVEKVGSAVTLWKVGDLACSRSGHLSSFIGGGGTGCWVGKLPATIDPKQATWFGLAKIAAMGAHAAEYRLGDSVAVIGAGPIGQMTIRWAAAAGVDRLVAVDPLRGRLELARRGGASQVVCGNIGDVQAEIRAACGGELPRVVVDTTGHAAVFAEALKLPAKYGRLVLIGDTGTPGQQHLTGDVISRGLTVVGAHDSHEEGQWTTPNLMRLFCHLVEAGRFNLEGLNTDTFRPEQCVQAYALANARNSDTMGIIFDWTQA